MTTEGDFGMSLRCLTRLTIVIRPSLYHIMTTNMDFTAVLRSFTKSEIEDALPVHTFACPDLIEII